MEDAVSGCCAIELSADATARPSPNAGPTLPIAIQIAAEKTEIAPIKVMLSIINPPMVV